MGIIGFIGAEGGACFNFLFASILFFPLGLVTAINYDYALNSRDGPNGQIVSGRSGSGVVPITSFLWAASVLMLCSRIVSFEPAYLLYLYNLTYF